MVACLSRLVFRADIRFHLLRRSSGTCFLRFVCTLTCNRSIYQVHDDAKDKQFELELGWVCDESNKMFQKVPADVHATAVAAAKAALEEDMED